MSSAQPVAVVTGGGNGIGAAIAGELGRQGWTVVTVDPLVTVDGSEHQAGAGQSTAERIVAAGGTARASSVSVTDADAIEDLFTSLYSETGRLDAVINLAGISRPTGFGRGAQDDWEAVLSVHLGGYLNVLRAALPIMIEAGRGRVVGVTSGSGWRAADAGAYSCAKRAVASLTWQIGRHTPDRVTVNALSPIAVTRMVTGALSRRGGPAEAAAGAVTGAGPPVPRPAQPATGSLSLGSMPDPEELGPVGAFMAGEGLRGCRGRVLFAAGSEVAVIDEPRLIEVVGTNGPVPGALLESVVPAALVPAEQAQASQGGSNARFTAAFSALSAAPGGPGGHRDGGAPTSCAVVSDQPDFAALITARVEAAGLTCRRVEPAHGFDGATAALRQAGAVDAVVVALATPGSRQEDLRPWVRILDEHAGLVGHLRADAAWAVAATELAGQTGRPVTLVTLSDAATSGGRSRAQASAQAARVAASSTRGAVTAFAVAVEAGGQAAAAELTSHLLGRAESTGLAGAELAAGPGWVGVRSHPRPAGSIAYGGPSLPSWFDSALEEMVG